MVKKPEPAPKRRSAKAFDAIYDAILSGDLVDSLNKANREYLYWDRFKHLEFPDGIKPEDAWAYVKTTRRLSMRSTPIVDVHGDRFRYAIPDEVHRCLHIIDQRAGGNVTADQAGVPANDRDRYLVSSLMEEAIASSQIEGAATTLKVAKDMLRERREPQNRSERMIVNNYRTITAIRELKNDPLTPELLLRLQALMTDGTLPDEDVGRYRRADEEVVVIDEANTVLHVPPPASQIPGEMTMLCEYANDEDREKFVHPVIKAIILHFWLAYLHPFIDGNGRTARALFYFYMLKRGYWLLEYLPISRVMLNRRTKYEKAFLYSEVDDADLTYFLIFNLHAIETSLGELADYIAKKTKEDAAIQVLLKEQPGINHRQRAVLSRVLRVPDARCTIASHQTSHNISYRPARSDLLDLVESGFMQMKKVGKAFVFVAAPDLRDRLGMKTL